MRSLLVGAACASAVLTVRVAGAQTPSGNAMRADSTSAEYREGSSMGDSVAARSTSFGWFGRGVVAGTLTGPVGLWWVTKRASHSSASPSGAIVQQSADARFTDGFRAGYTNRMRSERKEYAFMGGAVGTAVFAYALIRLSGLNDHTSSRGDPGGGGPVLIRFR